MKIRKFKKGDIKEVATLIVNTYKKCNSSEFVNDKSAAQKYMDHFDPKLRTLDELYKIFMESPIFLIAEEKDEIVGMIRGNTSKISNLFIKTSCHGRGFGGRLVKKFEKHAKKLGSNKISIKSTLYAAPFYEKMGYKKTAGIIEYMGLKVYPMSKTL